MIKNILNLGDSAIYCDFGSEVNKEINHEVIKYFKTLTSENIKGITNLAPSYNKLIITFDLDVTNFKELSEKIINLKLDEINETASKKKIIPICIDEEFALDIDRVSKNTNLNIKEIYQHILNKDFYCYMTGFVAGMPFLGDTNKNIRLKRLETPRVKVPKGSVGITEQFCNIYTYESPGGWNIIGNTPVKVFDENKEENPILIEPGDSIQFYEITKNEFYKIKGIK
ncbi:allophanate hydrolase subunit 1 [Candidatus Pelagibacter sp.]|nr:allophanate hydrolase subunit 1 [Candidatus Pelagibacter sp.]